MSTPTAPPAQPAPRPSSPATTRIDRRSDPVTTARPTPAPRRTTGGIPFPRLVAVELRKQVDTRAGVWLLTTVVLVNAGLIAILLFTGGSQDLTWMGLTNVTSLIGMLVLPLIGVMAATSEWSQRTALTTFALEPRRTRVNRAKLTSANALGLVVMALTLLAAAVGNVVGAVWRDGDGSWAVDAGLLGGNTLALLIFVTQGVAFGLLLLSTPLAIVAYLAVPTVWAIVAGLVPALREPGQWLDMNLTTLPLMAGDMTGDAWARLTVSVAVWVALPLALGLWRTARRDVS